MQLNIQTRINQNSIYKQRNITAKRHVPDNISFKGGGFLNTLASNDFLRYTFIDLAILTAPRAVIDAIFTNPFAVFETVSKETCGTLADFTLLPASAFGTSLAFEKFGNLKKIKTTTWANAETRNTFKDIYKHVLKDSNQQNRKQVLEKFIGEVLNRSEILNKNWTSVNVADKAERLAKSIEKLAGIYQDNWKAVRKFKGKDAQTELNIINEIRDEIAKEIGGRDNLRLLKPNNSNKKEYLSTSLNTLFRDLKDIGISVFGNPNIIKHDEAGNLAKKESKTLIKDAFDRLKTCSKTRSILTVSAILVFLFGNQYMNRMITKIKSGKDEYPGYKDFCKDIKPKNKPESKDEKQVKKDDKKLGFSGIGNRLNNLLGKLEIQGFLPHNDLYTTEYATTIAGRFPFVREPIELLTTLIKDGFSFFNLLFLGDLATKGYAAWANRENGKHISVKGTPELSILNITPLENGLKEGNTFKDKVGRFMKRTSVKSYDEIRDYAHNIADKMFKNGTAQEKKDLAKVIMDRLNKAKTRAMGVGLLYSGLTLGIGLPLLNAFLGNTFKSKKAKEQEAKTTLKPQPSINSDLFKKFYVDKKPFVFDNISNNSGKK